MWYNDCIVILYITSTMITSQHFRNIFTLALFLLWSFPAFNQAFFQELRDYSRQAIPQEIKDGYRKYTVDLASIHELASRSTDLKLMVPIGNEIKKLVFTQVNLIAPNAKIFTDDGRSLDFFEHKAFWGYIEGDKENSAASLILTDQELQLTIVDKDGVFEVHHKGNLYEAYFTENLDASKIFECHAQEERSYQEFLNKGPQASQRSTGQPACVEIYFEIDHASYTENGGNINSVTNWFVSLFNQVALQYNRIDVPLKVSGLKIYTQPDPYVPHGTATNALYAFRDSMVKQGYPGQLAHLLIGRAVGGGVAYLGGICNTYNSYAVSGNMNAGVTGYPTYSWNVNVIAHELGHNFGSPHTHDCSWNGNSTAIDGCATSPGACPDGPIPANGVGGTIMSYCHLQGGIGINPINGFGPQPAALIYNRYTSAVCFNNNDCSSVPPTNDVCFAARPLYPNHSCLVFEYALTNATTTPGLANLTCDTTSIQKDVWFSFVMPQSGRVTIQTSQISNGLEDMVLGLYSGSCGSMNLIRCDDNGAQDLHSMIAVDSIALAGQTLFIRVIEKGSNMQGSFGLCIYSDDLPCSTESAILGAFYEEHNGPLWAIKNGWEDFASNQNCDICAWPGVQCNEKLEVIGLSLGNNNLTGKIDTLLSKLKSLKTLDLSHNLLTDTIDISLFKIPTIKEINLSNNALSGKVDLSYNISASIKKVILSNNQFSGSLPYFRYGIDTIDLSNNLLEGCYNYSCYNFCTVGQLSLAGNALLPDGGNQSFFCLDQTGIDNDGDGYCFNKTDCNDQNSKVYPGAPEICDAYDNDCNGGVDEGFMTDNDFVGTDTIWHKAANWSLGMVPIACHNVGIGLGGSLQTVHFPGSGGQGGGSESSNTFNTIHIGPDGSLVLNPFVYVTILGGHLWNEGTLHAKGSLFMQSVMATTGNGLVNEGVMTIDSQAYIQVQNIIGIGIYNKNIILNNGDLSATSYTHKPLGIIGIRNEGIISGTSGNILVDGVFTQTFLQNMNGGQISNKEINIRDQSIRSE